MTTSVAAPLSSAGVRCPVSPACRTDLRIQRIDLLVRTAAYSASVDGPMRPVSVFHWPTTWTGR